MAGQGCQEPEGIKDPGEHVQGPGLSKEYRRTLVLSTCTSKIGSSLFSVGGLES